MSNPNPMTQACPGPGQTHTTNNTTYIGQGQIHTTANDQANVTIHITDKQSSNLVRSANVSQQAASTENSQPKSAGFGPEVRLANIQNLPGDLLLVDRNDIVQVLLYLPR